MHKLARRLHGIEAEQERSIELILSNPFHDDDEYPGEEDASIRKWETWKDALSWRYPNWRSDQLSISKWGKAQECSCCGEK
ncbi:uncharacterized protein L201_004349 [Kwoniella dendrophila CBS 6074]|uniref:Uncharacterized protein n=1 Tax=Kwoniella dendrophila CBS 6074 TaxID=1295534 RepID=A0AAX4JVF8_9TREE